MFSLVVRCNTRRKTRPFQRKLYKTITGAERSSSSVAILLSSFAAEVHKISNIWARLQNTRNEYLTSESRHCSLEVVYNLHTFIHILLHHLSNEKSEKMYFMQSKCQSRSHGSNAMQFLISMAIVL